MSVSERLTGKIVLTRNTPANARAKRKNSYMTRCQQCSCSKDCSGMECDEWPPASAVEAVANIKKVRGLSNGVHGKFLNNFYSACGIIPNTKWTFQMKNTPWWCAGGNCKDPCWFCDNKTWGCGISGTNCA